MKFSEPKYKKNIQLIGCMNWLENLKWDFLMEGRSGFDD